MKISFNFKVKSWEAQVFAYCRREGTQVSRSLYGGYTVGATFGLACNIKHLKELYDKNRAKDDE